MKKRIIAIALSTVMMLSMTPSTAYGAAADQPATGTEYMVELQEEIPADQGDGKNEMPADQNGSKEETSSDQDRAGDKEEAVEDTGKATEKPEDTEGDNGSDSEELSEAVLKVQALINALPDAENITEENVEAVMTQLDQIDEAKAGLTDDEMAKLDLTRYDEAIVAVNKVMGMEGDGAAVYAAVGMSEPPMGKHTIGARTVDAYEISTKEQLYWFANAVNTSEYELDYNAVLMKDITVNTGVLDSNGNLKGGSYTEWTPIGKYYSNSEKWEYSGRFDGQGHTISGLYCNSNANYVGLFGLVEVDSLIQNVGVKDSYFCGNSYVGGFIGRLLGRATITRCYTTAVVKGTTAEVGSFVGFGHARARINQCFSTGNVNGERNVGKFMGGTTKPNAYNCYSLADTSGSDSGVAYKTMEQFKSGEVAYWLNYPDNGDDSVFRQNIGTDAIPAFSGKVVYYGDGKYHNHSSSNKICIYCDKPELKNGIYQIKTKENLYWFSALVNGTNGLTKDAGAKAVLKADITADSSYTPIGNSSAFAGSFDGEGHTISGLTNSLFGTNSGTITNYTLSSGTLCTTNNGTISKCISDGGMLCDTNASTIQNCYVKGSGSSKTVLCRVNSGTIVNCYSANKSGSADICNSGTGSIINCYYLSGSRASAKGTGSALKTLAPFASGEVAYLLNNGSSSVWYQNIDNDNPADETPVFSGGKVYKTTADSPCQGYTNNSNGIRQHNFVNGICDYCGNPETIYVTVSGITAKNKTYDGTTEATLDCGNVTITGLESGDDVKVTAKGTFADKNAETNKTVNITELELSGADADKYTIADTGNQTTAKATISKKSVTATVNVAIKDYDGTTTAYFSAGVPKSDICSGDTIIVSGLTANFDSEVAGNHKPVYIDTTNKSITGAGSGNYVVTIPDRADGTIRKRNLSVQVAYETITYGDAAPEYTAVFTGLATCDRTNGFKDDLIISCPYVPAGDDGATSLNSKAGDYKITASGLKGWNYNIIYKSGTLTVKPKEIGITWGTTTFDYNESRQIPEATATGALNGDVLSLTVEPVTGNSVDAGTYTAEVTGITGEKAANYKLPAEKTHSYKINLVTLGEAVIKVQNPGSLIYTGTEVKPDIVVTLGDKALKDGIDYTTTYSNNINATTGVSETAHISNTVNASKATVTITGKGNYNDTVSQTFDIKKKDLEITAENKTIKYGEDSPIFTASYEGFVNGETAQTTGALTGTLTFDCAYIKAGSAGTGTSDEQNSKAGTYVITPKGLTSANYDITFIPGSLVVDKADGQVTIGAVGDKTYGDAAFALLVDKHGSDGALNFESSDAGIMTVDADGMVTLKHVGTATITVRMAEGTNYKAAQNTIDITVVQKGAKLEVSSLAYTATYGDEDIDLGLTTEGESEVIYTTSNSNVATAGAGKLHIVGVGTATINLSMAASANYLAKDVDISVTIVPSELIITADDKETVYGTDAPEFTVSYSGFKNGDSAGKVGVLTGTLVFHCDYVNGDDTYGIAGAYDIVPDGLAAGNYTITYKKGTLTVKKIESTVSIEDVAEKTYGDGAFDLSVTSTGSRNTPVYTSSDTSVLTVDGSGRVAVKGAGTATVTVTIPEETNYSSAVGSVTIMVKKKTLVVTAEDKNIDQGDAAPAYTVTYDGFVNGDNEIILAVLLYSTVVIRRQVEQESML